MHCQVLVIYPPDVDLEDVMYPYQEVNKYQKEKMEDGRCEFFLGIEEKDICSALRKIENRIKERINEYLEIIQYRCDHTYEETEEKYGKNALKHTFGIYKSYCDDLKEYHIIKDLKHDDPRQIKFIKENSYDVVSNYADIYIKGVGYGSFINPYELWDYYQPIKDRGFHKEFLIGNDGLEYVQIALRDLNVTETVKNIHELSYVWEHIIFCEKDPSKSMIYTIDDIRFKYKWNEHCLIKNILGVESLEDVLLKLSGKYDDRDYIVIALDFHW